eukprot:CAMPEP_0196662626 /NCGR_PEP_ID=MMETSP1086-20130531/49593_1 /TAXON_ID=77921 /ORGANISM="Cyanoptyche  gloeocystis , Strain SAG4.97" /LENGTH=52 /DNA_ID=CAMNT_0041998123 /DNA_START=62 /DNA_END=217 /DNA_ORIENTATION=+
MGEVALVSVMLWEGGPRLGHSGKKQGGWREGKEGWGGGDSEAWKHGAVTRTG